MAMLSYLLRYRLVDEHGNLARLLDFAVDLSSGDYPRVTDVVVRAAGNKIAQRLPAGAPLATDRGRRVFRVADLGAARAPAADWLAETVFLKRDVLDAMVLDLQDRFAYRANDLVIAEQDGSLFLTAVDVSLRAILRRMTRGVFRSRSERFIRDWRSIEYLRGDPAAARSGEDYHGLIARLPAGEIADLADALPYLHAAELLTLLPDTKAADTLESMLPERQLQVFEQLAVDRARRLLALMRPDIVADLLGRLDTDRARYWLERLPIAQFSRVVRLLSYPEDSAGGIMTNDLITLPEDMSVGEGLAVVREQLKLPAFINFIQNIYIVDRGPVPHLRGVLSLRELLIAEADQRMSEIMAPYIVIVQPHETAKVAARRVVDSDLAALPVVGHEGELLGAITVDAALRIAAPAGWGQREAPKLFS